MSIAPLPAEQQLVLHDVDWHRDSRLLRAFGEYRVVRIT